MSIENSRYSLSKNGDILILTDKKTLKSRNLDIDDIDYVIDDNQKFRDTNIIENYFRLKDEPYEPTLKTKQADYVKEYREMEKITKKVPQDLVEEFIKRFSLSDNEIRRLGEVPEELTIRKFKTRSDEEIRQILNDFRILKRELKEKDKVGTDIFTYLKAYFGSYIDRDKLVDAARMNIEDLFKDRDMYSREDYELIKDKDITNLQELYDLGIKKIWKYKFRFINYILQ